MRYFTRMVLIYCLPLSLFAQTTSERISNTLKGYWEGAFIKNNSYQKLDIQFYEQEGALNSLQIIEEWHPQFGEFVLPVTIDSLNAIRFNTGYGKAVMQLDTVSLEMVGSVENTIPSVYIHLKKTPNPPPPNYTVEEISVPNDTIQLYGHLHQPKNGPFKTAMILVGGRGCYAGSTQYDLYAKLLRDYGISVLVFNKRGTGKSNGNCDTATIDDLASDVAACHRFLQNHPNNYQYIGVLGSSAGGWVMAKAEEKVDFDFMISMVGPSTSVKEQQLQSMDYGFDFYKLAPEAKEELLEYTNLMFDAKANERSLKRFQSLLVQAEINNWKQLLDDTDIPSDVSGIDDLWVRRHAYDPGKVLGSFNKPFLAVYGEIDWIVPYRENIARLETLFSGERNNLLTTIVAPNAEHGTETKDAYVSLANGQSYWRFFRISPVVQIELIHFLKQHQFID